jgi:pyrimidine-nucleoside phosphorylase
MDVISIINKKRANLALTKDEISYSVKGFLDGEIKDYQMSSLLMAICINGMNNDEITSFTDAMINSGDIIDLSSIEGIKVDKHSTGGVGDKTTLIVGPLVASCGVKVAKISGRGLGHTGGTIDKLESINGFKTDLSNEEFVNQVRDIGIVIATSTSNLVLADKKIYELRDVTGTVSSIPLIAASIMSKKIATGADKIVLDVKIGKGSLVRNHAEAVTLARTMVNIGNYFNKQTVAFLTNMNSPLGNNIGNGLEIIEAMEILSNRGNRELKDLCILIASYMVSLGKNIDPDRARKLVVDNLNNGNAYQKFIQLVEYQHGNINDIKLSDNIVEVMATDEGYVINIDALKMGNLSMDLGAGRKEKNDVIDLGVGIVLAKNIGDTVKSGDLLARVYLGQKEIDLNEVKNAFEISKARIGSEMLMFGIIK